jgi:hypothetical protein
MRRPRGGRALAASFLLTLSACGRAGVEAPPPAGPGGSGGGPAPFHCRLVDITAASGIRFRHVTGGYGDKLLPETLGSGAAFLDFDGDGVLDVFFVNSSFWPGREPPGADSPPRCALYRGLGGGRFEDAGAGSGADLSLYGMGCAAADYDGDGDTDIYVTAVGDNVLLRNDGGRFADATREAGVAGGRWRDRGGKEHPEWSTAAAWLDADGDGDLDLFVANYVQWSPAHEIFTTLDGIQKAFTTPDRYPGLPCRLFLNRGGGGFEDATEAAGLAKDLGKALGVTLWDFDGDGRLDVAVANDTRPNFLFRNLGGGRFEELGLKLGIAYDESGRARAGMGIDVADFAGDGWPRVAIGNFSSEPMSLYRWSKDGLFHSDAARAGLAEATYGPLTFGVAFADLDLDGFEDLAVVNGHIEPDIARFQAGQSHAQRPQLFRGRADGRFDDVSSACGPDFARPLVGRGLAAGDVDGDGDLDLLITQNGGPPVLYRNDLAAGAPRRYLRVKLRGKGANSAALGAEVRVQIGGRSQIRTARTGSSYLSQSEPTLTFGLGASDRVDAIEVRWPSGGTTRHPIERIDATIEIREE